MVLFAKPFRGYEDLVYLSGYISVMFMSNIQQGRWIPVRVSESGTDFIVLDFKASGAEFSTGLRCWLYGYTSPPATYNYETRTYTVIAPTNQSLCEGREPTYYEYSWYEKIYKEYVGAPLNDYHSLCKIGRTASLKSPKSLNTIVPTQLSSLV